MLRCLKVKMQGAGVGMAGFYQRNGFTTTPWFLFLPSLFWISISGLQCSC